MGAAGTGVAASDEFDAAAEQHSNDSQYQLIDHSDGKPEFQPAVAAYQKDGDTGADNRYIFDEDGNSKKMAQQTPSSDKDGSQKE